MGSWSLVHAQVEWRNRLDAKVIIENLRRYHKEFHLHLQFGQLHPVSVGMDLKLFWYLLIGFWQSKYFFGNKAQDHLRADWC